MIDIKLIRENPDKYKKAAIDKHFKVDVDRLLELDGELKSQKQQLQELTTEFRLKKLITYFIQKISICHQMEHLTW